MTLRRVLWTAVLLDAAAVTRRAGLPGVCRKWIALAAAAAWLPAAAWAQIYNSANVTGSLSLKRVVNLRQQAQPLSFQAFRLAAPAPEELRILPPRMVPPGVSVPSFPSKLRSAAAMPRASLTPSALPSAKALAFAPASGTTGFNALSHLDQRLAFNGNQFSVEPPNPSIAVGNGYVLEGVNNAVQVYDSAGTPLLPQPLASNQVFGVPPALDRISLTYGVYPTDMRVYFDQGIKRWFIIQRAQDYDIAGNALTSSHLYMAVSQTGDPTASYNVYVMDTTNPANPGCPCIADYPQIGSDHYGFHIAWNEFSYVPAVGFYWFVDASVLVLSKSALAAGAAAPSAVQFLLPYVSSSEFSLQPAAAPPGASNFLASGGVEFFVSTASTSGGDRVTVWAMSNTASLTTANPAPILTRTEVPVLPYVTPNPARQRAGPIPYGSSLFPPEPLALLDGGDVRVQAVAYASGRLYVTFASGVRDEQGQFVVGTVYVVLSPTYRAGVLSARVISQGYLVVNGNDLLRPAIAVNSQGNGAIAVTLTGPDWYPSAALIPFQATSPPSVIQVAGLGTGPEDGFTGYSTGGGFGVARWGDYSTAAAASDGSIWMVTQYIGPYPRSEFANWNTYIYRKQP